MAILYCLLIALPFAAVPYALALLVRRFYGHWPKRAQYLLSALPLPALIAAGSIALLINVVMRPLQACQKNLCYIDQMFGIGGLILAAITFVIGLAVAGVTLGKEGRAEA